MHLPPAFKLLNTKAKTNTAAFSAQAAAAAGEVTANFCGLRCVVSATDPYAGHSQCSTAKLLFFPFKQLLNYPHKTQRTPLQTHYFSENPIALGIEPGTCDH
jgi:hypothetical protein